MAGHEIPYTDLPNATPALYQLTYGRSVKFLWRLRDKRSSLFQNVRMHRNPPLLTNFVLCVGGTGGGARDLD